MRTTNVIKAFGLCGAMAGAAGCATTAAMEQELAKTNTQTVLAFEETVYNKHEVGEAFRHYVGATYTEHDPDRAENKETAIRALGELFMRAYPRSHLTIRRAIAQGDYVATQGLWTPRPGEGPGVDKVDIYRLQGGRIVEHWDVTQPAVKPGS